MAKGLKCALAILSIGLCSTLVAQNSVSELSWMKGSWTGALGPNAIEEVWTKPNSTSLQASVRIVAGGSTVVHEFVVISQTADGLVLFLQQWGRDFTPLSPATKMKMTEMTENSVTFEAGESAAIVKLSYRRADADTFEITFMSKGGPETQIVLKPNQ